MADWIIILESTLRVTTPLLFAALGGLLSERAGVVNIALEGMMLMGAFFGASFAHFAGSPAIGLIVGGLAGALLAALYGLFVIRFRSDQIVAGTAINLLAMGLTPFLAKVFFDSNGSTPSLEMSERFEYAPVVLVWLTALAVTLWYRFSRSGLWVQMAGEHPVGLATAGISVLWTRWSALLMSGFLAGVGGVSLSVFLASSYTRNMAAGRGFMALAALILGKWKPIPTTLACLLFGAFEAMQIRLQGVKLWNDEAVPVQWIQILPYLVTLVVLAGVVGKSRAPLRLGRPYP